MTGEAKAFSDPQEHDTVTRHDLWAREADAQVKLSEGISSLRTDALTILTVKTLIRLLDDIPEPKELTFRRTLIGLIQAQYRLDHGQSLQESCNPVTSEMSKQLDGSVDVTVEPKVVRDLVKSLLRYLASKDVRYVFMLTSHFDTLTNLLRRHPGDVLNVFSDIDWLRTWFPDVLLGAITIGAGGAGSHRSVFSAFGICASHGFVFRDPKADFELWRRWVLCARPRDEVAIELLDKYSDSGEDKNVGH